MKANAETQALPGARRARWPGLWKMNVQPGARGRASGLPSRWGPLSAQNTNDTPSAARASASLFFPRLSSPPLLPPGTPGKAPGTGCGQDSQTPGFCPPGYQWGHQGLDARGAPQHSPGIPREVRCLQHKRCLRGGSLSSHLLAAGSPLCGNSGLPSAGCPHHSAQLARASTPSAADWAPKGSEELAGKLPPPQS